MILNTNSLSFSNIDNLRIDNEIEVLSAIYPENIKKISMKSPNNVIQMKIFPDSMKVFQGKFPMCWIKLKVEYQLGYPRTLPRVSIYKKYNMTDAELLLIKETFDDVIATRSAENIEMMHEVFVNIQKLINDKAKMMDPTRERSTSRSKSFSPREHLKSSEHTPKKLNAKLFGQKEQKSTEFNEQQAIEHLRPVNREDSSELCLNNKQTTLNLTDEGDYYLDLKNPSPQRGFSRFKTDFLIIDKIGQGGGGSVFKVKHIWDGMFYAIKRIKLYTHNLDSVKIVHREVMVLSRLQHPHIVRYFQSWIEDYEKEEDEEKSEEEDEYEVNTDNEEESQSKIAEEANENGSRSRSSENNMDQVTRQRKMTYEGKSIQFVHNADSEEMAMRKNNSDEGNSIVDSHIIFEDKPGNEKYKRDTVWENENENENEDDIQHFPKKKLSKCKYLYIQMEYCEGHSLKDAIEGKTLTKNEMKWTLITQILEALCYIHSKGIIHRDIKPGNIFRDMKNVAKLGDFGLAKVSKSKSQLENLNMMNKKEFITANENEILSCAVGTLYYCSPEQEKNIKIDEKSDMFSLGITIFEMFYSFGSLMERDLVLRGIKDENKFPIKFLETIDKNIVNMVKWLTLKDPAMRPSAYELLNSSLIPLKINEKAVIENFNKIIEENKNYTTKFIEILIKKNKITTSSFPLSNDIYTDNYSYSFDSYTAQLGTTGNSHFIFALYDRVVQVLKKIFKVHCAMNIRFSEIETYLNCFPVFDSVQGGLYYFNYDNEEGENGNGNGNGNSQDNIMLTKSGDVVKSSRSIYRQLGKFVTQSSSIRNPLVFLPMKVYCDALSSEVTSNNRIQESHEITLTSLWTKNDEKGKVLIDSDEKYEYNCLDILFQSLEDLDMISNIQIRINSSKILDLLFSKVLNNSDKDQSDAKFQTLFQLSKYFNEKTNDEEFTLKDLKQKLNQNKKSGAIPNYNFALDKAHLNELISWMEINGDLETWKKRFEKKDLYYEINQICSLCDYSSRFKNYRHKFRLDFSLLPRDLAFYSGIFLQVVYQESENEKFVICEGGRIDNLINSEFKDGEFINRGFSLRYFPMNLYKIKFLKIKEKDEDNYICDILIIRTCEDFQVTTSNSEEDTDQENEIIKYIFALQKEARDSGLSCQCIFRTQVSTNFMDFFKIYRMKSLLILYKDNQNKINIEFKFREDRKRVYSKDHFNLIEAYAEQLDSFNKKKVCKK